MNKAAHSQHYSGHAPTEAPGGVPVLSLLLNDQRQRWRRGENVFVEAYLESTASLQEDQETILDLINNEVVLRGEKGETPQLGEYLKRFEPFAQKFPNLATQLRLLFEVEGMIQGGSVSTSPTMTVGENLDSFQIGKPSSPPAERMVGSYEILGELGRGAMGVVYRARQWGLNRIVALKMVLSGDYASAADVVRFRSEAEAVAHLQHPHIVHIYEVGEHEGLPFFSLEFVTVGSLAKKIGGTPMPPRQAAELTETLARAVHYAHQRGIIHRDLKPGNVLLAEDGTPKITDFGLAKRVQAETSSGSPVPLTRSGDIMGTPSYMAPEQALGKTQEIGPVTDVYALGAILYELLTGRPPFLGASPVETLHQVIFDDLVAPGTLQPKLPRDLETICLKSLQKEARRRYATAEELADDLRRFQGGETIRARRTALWERGIKFAKRRPAWAVIFLSLPIVSAALLILSVYALTKEEQAKFSAREARVAAIRAEQGELDARRQAYRYALTQAWDEWQKNQVGLAATLLNGLKPERSGQKDLRGFEWYYLNKLCHSDLRTIPGAHTAVAFSPDGRLVAAAGSGNSAGLWDIETGKQIQTFAGHDGPIKTIAFQPDGRLIATGGEDRTVRIWQAATGRLVHTLREHQAAVNSIAFRPDGRRLVSAGNDARVIIWDVEGAERVATFNGHSQPVYAVAYSADGRLIASAGGDGNVLIWEESRKIIRQLPAEPENAMTALAFHPEGGRLATGSLRGTVALWNLFGSDEPTARPLSPGHIDVVRGMAFSPDGSGLVTGGADRTMRIFDVEHGTLIRVIRGHNQAVTAVAFSPVNSLIASAGEDPAVKIWDAGTEQEAIVLGGPGSHTALVRDIAFSPDGRKLASAGYDKRLKIWDTLSGDQVRSIDAHTAMVNCVAYSPDGVHLASGSADRTVKIWDVKKDSDPLVLRGHADSVECLAYNSDGQLLASGAKDGTIRISDIAKGKSLRTLRHPRGTVIGLAFSPDGLRIASGGEDRLVHVWDVRNGSEIWQLEGHSDAIDTVAYSPDGKYIASGGHDKTVRIWDAKSGKLIRSLEGHEKSVQGLVFTGDAEHLISVGPDRSIRFWDVEGGVNTFSLQGDPDWVATYCVAISPDSKRLAWGGGRIRQGEIRLLDATAGWKTQ